MRRNVILSGWPCFVFLGQVENARKAKLLVKKLQKENEERQRKIMERKMREEEKIRRDLDEVTPPYHSSFFFLSCLPLSNS
jgi:hypothetical protein